MARERPPASRCAVRVPTYLEGSRARVVAVLEELIAEQRRRSPGIEGGREEDDPYGPILYDLMLDYPLREAKGLRPALCIATCRALGGNLEAALPTASVLELYHNAFLVHDDIEDRSHVRRGGPTLHAAHGQAIAVNVGDGMLALTLRPLLTNIERVGLGPALRILEAMAEMSERTVEGQAMELDWIRRNTWELSDDDYIEMVVRKTGWYSFIIPTRCGALCARAEPTVREQLERFARDLSVAFQIQDDVLNLVGGADEIGKDARGDLWEGKRTLVLLHALRTAAPADRDRAVAILAKSVPEASLAGVPSLLARLEGQGQLAPTGRAELERALGLAELRSAAEVDALMELIEAQGSIDHARQRAREHVEAARASLEACDAALLDSSHRDLLWGLVDFVLERRW